MKVLGGLRRPPQLDVDFFDIKLSNPPLVNSNIKSFEKKQKKRGWPFQPTPYFSSPGQFIFYRRVGTVTRHHLAKRDDYPSLLYIIRFEYIKHNKKLKVFCANYNFVSELTACLSIALLFPQ